MKIYFIYTRRNSSDKSGQDTFINEVANRIKISPNNLTKLWTTI